MCGNNKGNAAQTGVKFWQDAQLLYHSLERVDKYITGSVMHDQYDARCFYPMPNYTAYGVINLSQFLCDTALANSQVQRSLTITAAHQLHENVQIYSSYCNNAELRHYLCHHQAWLS